MLLSWIRRFAGDDGGGLSPRARARYELFCGLLGIFFNLCLFGIKLAAGLLSGSVAVLSDAFNNLSDLGSSAVGVVGAKLSAQQPDEKHPYGHGRLEYIAALCVAVMILLVGLELGKSSVEKFFSPAPVTFSVLTAVILLLSVLCKLFMFWYNRRIGKRIDSVLLRAAAQDSLFDAIATTVVLLGSVLGLFVSFPVDALLGVCVSLLILRGGISVAKETIDLLIGEAPDEALSSSLRALVLSGEGVLGAHDLIIHNYGPGRNIASVHAEVDANCDLCRTHEVIDALEQRAKTELGTTLVIHMDPIITDDPRLDALRERLAAVIAEVDPAYSFHDFRITDGEQQINLIFDIVVPLSQKESEYEKKLQQIKNALQALDPRYRVVLTLDRH